MPITAMHTRGSFLGGRMRAVRRAGPLAQLNHILACGPYIGLDTFGLNRTITRLRTATGLAIAVIERYKDRVPSRFRMA